MIEAVRELAPVVGVAAACGAFGLPRATWYRALERERGTLPPRERPTPARALSLPERRAVLGTFAATLEGLTIEIEVQAGEEDKIFGSVTNATIAEKLGEMGHEIDRRTIRLDEPIKSLGAFVVPVQLGGGVEAKLKIWVSGAEEQEQEEE